MNKFKGGIVALILILSFTVGIFDVHALTLADKKKELQSIKDEQAEMEEISKKIKVSEENEKRTKREIEDLEDKIDKKEEEIKELISFYQVSNNENFYLKYLFGSESFTDFIYRFSVIEQLTKRSDELVDEMNDLIEDNNKKIKEYESLYKSYGCSEKQSLESCLNSKVPQSYNGFISPVKSGIITDNFGWRYLSGMGGWNYHSGIDIGGNREGTSIMAAAAGRVSCVILYPSSGKGSYGCGGQQVFINHIVSGKYYTTVYKHLLKVNVKVGDIVVQGQVIDTQGGGKTASYDSGTFGTHLHLSVATGHYYGIGANSYSTSITSHLIEPRNIINYPAYGKSFSWK